MVKDRKKKGRSALTKEQIYRKNLVDNYNKAYTDRRMLYRKPKEEEIEAMEKRLQDMKDNRNAMKYFIADAANAHRVVDFLEKFNSENVFWGKDMWKGIIEFDKILKSWKEENLNKNDVNFELDFPAMFYCYTVFNNPAGKGIESAKYMASIEEEYNAILNLLNEYVDDFNKEQEKFKVLNDIYSTMQQGYMVVLKEDEEKNGVVSDEEIEVEETLVEESPSIKIKELNKD